MLTFSNPTVSVIMPVYNSEDYLFASINSVVQQTFGSWELLIIDDYSSDGSLKICKYLSETDLRIRILVNEGPKGAAGARNTGLKNTKGKYVAFLDADDIWYSDKLKSQVEYMEATGSNFTFSHTDVIDLEGRHLRIVKTPKSVSAKDLRYSNTIPCLTVMYRKEKASDIMQPNLPSRNDFALWLEILNRSEITSAQCIPKVLAAYRENDYGISSKRFLALKYFWICQYTYNNSGIMTAGFRTIVYFFISVIKKKAPKIYNLFFFLRSWSK